MSGDTAARKFRLGLAAFLATALLASLQGCDRVKFGELCTLSVTAPSPTTYYLDANALACPSRICLLPAQQATADTGALCSLPCQTDADCEEGETRSSSDPTDRRCASGFSCQPIPMVPDASGSQSCRKLCACRDLLPAGAPAPAGCP